jgi:outer membrane protein W
MNFAAFLIVTTSLTASPGTPISRTVGLTPARVPHTVVSFDAQDPRRTPKTQTERPHQIGVGASLGLSNRGGGGAMRYWFGDMVGLDLQAAWSRPYTRATTAQGTTLSRGNAFQVLPSILINLKKPNQNANVDLRPYVGAGLNYLSSPRSTFTTTSSLDQRTNGVGGQAFGGVEMTFREAPNMTISGEGIYYNIPVQTISARAIQGFDYLVAFHYYLK